MRLKIKDSLTYEAVRVGGLGRMEGVERSVGGLATIRATERDLESLIGRIAQGDQSALGSLYDQTSSLVYGLALRILKDQPAAEDVTIEVYTQVHRQAAQYDAGRGAPSTWLLTLARSRAIDRFRVESRRRDREQPLETIEAIPTPAANPEDHSAAADRRRAVQTALLGLTLEQRQVIEIAYYSGLSHSEIAAKLGLPLGTVKTRIRNGMMALRELLHPLSVEGES